MDYEHQLIAIVQSDPQMMETLRAARSLHLPDWWIGAGFVRNKVWDVLHDSEGTYPPTDVDVLYYDENDATEERDTKLNAQLQKLLPNAQWECVNQARAHVWHNHQPYGSSINALATWVETATAVAVRLEDDDTISVAAPYGLDDLFAMRVTPTPDADPDDFATRHVQKGWLTRWPKLTVSTP